MIKTLLALMFAIQGVPTVLFAEDQTGYRSLVPYTVFSQYENTVSKENGRTLGIYGCWNSEYRHFFEADAAWSATDYGSYTLIVNDFPFIVPSTTINQFDATVHYTWYGPKNTGLHLGFHGVNTDDDLTDKGHVLFGGVFRYRPNEYDAGLTVYQSRYADFNDGLNVMQLTGGFGFYFGNPFTYGGLYAKTEGTFIETSENTGWGTTKFSSVSQSLRYSLGNFNAVLSVWTGEQVFGVQNAGFVVLNINELHEGAVKLDLMADFNSGWSGKLTWQKGRFKEAGMSGRSESSHVTCMAVFHF